MSGKRRKDYQAMLRDLQEELRRLHGEDVSFSLDSAMADFEAAVWQAFRHVFPAWLQFPLGTGGVPQNPGAGDAAWIQ